MLVADGFLVCLGNAEQHADHAHRHLRSQVRDEVEAPASDQRIEAPGAERTHLRLDRGHSPRSERAGEHAAMDVVDRRVFEDEHAGRHRMPALMISSTDPRAEL